MRNYLIVLILLVFSALTFAENHKQIKIVKDQPEALKLLAANGIAVEEAAIDRDGSIYLFLSDSEYELLRQTSLKFETLIDDWSEYYQSLPELTQTEKDYFRSRAKNRDNIEGFGYGSMGGYYTAEEVYTELDNMKNDFPDLITTKYSIGQTLEGREMYVVKISDNPDIDEDEPEVFINSLIHAREPAAMMSVMYYMFWLLENYGTDAEATYLVNNREIYFMPVFNVDGYEYNRQNDPGGGGMWRKNRRNNGNGTYGVDLNRNWGYMWGYDNNGSSPDPGDETYRGAAAFSEPATDVVRIFSESRPFKTGINFHTYSNLCIIPWGYINEETPDSLAFREYASEMTQFNGYEWGTAGAILYEVNGDADDWYYGEQTAKEKALTVTIEVGSWSDGFWPSQDRIFPLAEENLWPQQYITWAAGEFIKVENLSVSPEYFSPGETVTVSPVLKNKGLGAGYNLSATISSSSPYIIINSATIALDSIPARSVVEDAGEFEIIVSGAAPVGEPIYLDVAISSDGDIMTTQEVKIIPGIPTFMFEDSYDDPTVLWNITATPVNPKWEATTTTYHSGPVSYADSKSGEYASNCDVKLTMKDPVNLTGVSSAVLTFWTKYDIEDEWDAGQIEISTNNGSTWTPMETSLTAPGSGNGAQTSGEPVLDGTVSEWTFQEIDLSGYEGEQIKIRFELKADGYIEEDGWYLDDIKIYYYGGGSMSSGCADISWNEGWNLLSVPFQSTNMALDNIFPGHTSQAFYFTNSYQMTDMLGNDLGYWIKFPASGTNEICGQKIDDYVAVQTGWNMIGTNDTTVLTSNISSVPAGIIMSEYFEFDNGYVIAGELEPGKGYWVRASENGTIQINSTLNTSAAKENAEERITLRFEDAAGSRTELYILKEGESRMTPPLPPEGAFDIRFADGNYAETFMPGGNNIEMRGVSYPVQVYAFGGSLGIISGENERQLSDGEKISINSSVSNLTVKEISIPAEFELAQNYPNPFNPETTIRFGVPERAFVNLTIYNALGERVATLAKGQMDAGYHELNFDASRFASGTYIYELRAGEFRSVKKMMLMK